MPCHVAFGWASRGNTVPYPPSEGRVGHGRKRHNRGFVDLRGKPDDAAAVAEAADSPELRAWLVDLAKPGSALFSVGCDIGKYRKRRATDNCLHASGGYIQLLAADYAFWGPDEYKALAEPWAARVEALAGNDRWDLSFLLQTVRFNLDQVFNELVSLSVEFNTWASNAIAAKEARERLVRAVRLKCAQEPSSAGASLPVRES